MKHLSAPQSLAGTTKARIFNQYLQGYFRAAVSRHEWKCGATYRFIALSYSQAILKLAGGTKAESPQAWRKTTDWSPEISNRFRQRAFLHWAKSSRRSIYDWALAKRARSRSSARPGSAFFFVRTSQRISYESVWWQNRHDRLAGFELSDSSKKSLSSIEPYFIPNCRRMPCLVPSMAQCRQRRPKDPSKRRSEWSI